MYIIFSFIGSEDDTRVSKHVISKTNKQLKIKTTMSYANLLYTVPDGLRSLYRQYEQIHKKWINAHWSIEFNSICIKENILPNYSRIRYHDPAVASTETTLKYRKYLVERETVCKQKIKLELECKKEQCLREIESYDCEPNLKPPISEALGTILDASDNVVKTRTVKKLNSLYHEKNLVSKDASICIKSNLDQFINMSSYQLTSKEKEFMNLGMNCHIQPKYDKLLKQTELESLYQNLLQLETKKTISLKPELADQLRSESTKHRNTRYCSIITQPLRDAASDLRNNNNIVIRKADKSATYVILDKCDYLLKLNSILSDSSKFKHIKKDPTNTLKQKANKLIDTQNAAIGDLKLSKIIGDYQPGYVYGNVKIHKPNNPLRPIISQIPTPTYNLAKSLNRIISPYIPNEFMLNSSNDFIDLLHSSQHNGLVASLDVESLFTNVPIDPTIQIILQHTYKHNSLPPPKMPPEILKQLLELCTREAPFRCPENKLYLQVEGVAMGSPLGPTFANFYMGNLEKQLFENPANKPSIYARYVDDIFIQINNEQELIRLKTLFQNNSVLNFTYELSVDRKLPFLDVLVRTSGNEFKTKVYHKPTDQGNCLNANSECVEKYKNSVITNYMNRAFKISDSWQDFHNEMLHIKQVLVNNNYSNKMVDSQMSKFLHHKLTQQSEQQNITLIPLYYQSQMHSNYKIEERTLKRIIYNNTKCLQTNHKMNLVFYYKNKKTFNLIMKNNTSPPKTKLQQTNVIYKFQCPLPHSQAVNVEYVGLTQTSLSRRLTMHGQDGSIYKHFIDSHNKKPTREELTQNTEIIARAPDRHKLLIKEAILIQMYAPVINKQFDNFANILKLHNHRDTKYQNPSTHSVAIQPPPPMPPINITPHHLDTYIEPFSEYPPLTHPHLLDSPFNVQDLAPKPSQESGYPLSPTTTYSQPAPNNHSYPSFPMQPSPNFSYHSGINNAPQSTQNTKVCLAPPSSITEIPDMREVLNKFGIITENLNVVTLNNYSWSKFKIREESPPSNSQSISQRVHSLVREARYKSVTH